MKTTHFRFSATGYYLLALLLALTFTVANAQSSDAVKYYIAYDRSGSVANIDSRNNLQEMLKELLNITGNSSTVTTAADFEVYLFGQNSTNPKVHDYRDNVSVSVQELLSSTTRSREERVTHIHTALNAIEQAIDDNTGDISSGIFIFTDGRIDAADVDYTMLRNSDDININTITNYTEYRQYCSGIIKRLQLKTNNRIFFIQTSPPLSAYFTLLDSVIGGNSRQYLVDSFYAQNSNYFWLNTKQPLQDTTAGYLQAYRDFIYQANAYIVSPRELHPQTDVEVSILVQEILMLYRQLPQKTFTTESLMLEGTANNTMQTILSMGNIKTDKTLPLIDKDTDGPEEEQQQIENTTSGMLSAADITAIQGKINTLKNAETNNVSDLLKLKQELLEILNKQPEQAIPTGNILLTEAYQAAPPTPLTTIHDKKGLEDMEQALIEGLADYIIDRAKQEAVYAFLDNIDDLLGNELSQVRNILFPNVTAILKNQTTYPDLIILQTAFKEDIKRFPENIIKLKQLGLSDGLYSLYFFLRLYDHLKFDGSLEIAFSKVHTEINKEIKEKRTRDNTNTVSCAALRSLISLKITTGLISYLEQHNLAASYYNKQEQDLASLSELLIILNIDAADIKCIDIDNAAKNARIIYREYRAVKKQMSALQQLSDNKPTADFQGYREYQKDILLDILQRISRLMIAGTDIMNYINIACDTADCKNGPVDSAIKNDIRATARQMENAIEAWFYVKNKDYLHAMYNLAPELIKLMGTESEEAKKVQKLMYVSGEIATAQNADEVKNVIAKYTLPVASYKVKRNNHRSIMLTAYPGLGGVYYYDILRLRPAIISPIGFEFTHYTGSKSGRSFSLMLSIIDIGNVINYRLLGTAEGQTNSEDVVSFEGIFSPGLHLSYGMSEKYPLSLIAGYQYNPSRLTFGLVLDMPLLGIWTRN